jgi:hypothetical protein
MNREVCDNVGAAWASRALATKREEEGQRPSWPGGREAPTLSLSLSPYLSLSPPVPRQNPSPHHAWARATTCRPSQKRQAPPEIEFLLFLAGSFFFHAALAVRRAGRPPPTPPSSRVLPFLAHRSPSMFVLQTCSRRVAATTDHPAATLARSLLLSTPPQPELPPRPRHPRKRRQQRRRQVQQCRLPSFPAHTQL